MHDYLPTEITAPPEPAARPPARAGRRRGFATRRRGPTARHRPLPRSIGAAGIAGATVPARHVPPPAQGGRARWPRSGRDRGHRSGTQARSPSPPSRTRPSPSTWSSSTTYRAKSSGASLADVTVRAHVAVVGSLSGSNRPGPPPWLIGLALEAARGGRGAKALLAARGPRARRPSGPWASVGTSSFHPHHQVETRPSTVDVSSSTTYRAEVLGCLPGRRDRRAPHVAVVGSTFRARPSRPTSVLIGLALGRPRWGGGANGAAGKAPGAA